MMSMRVLSSASARRGRLIRLISILDSANAVGYMPIPLDSNPARALNIIPRRLLYPLTMPGHSGKAAPEST
jgi:hypothetical protein